MPVPQRTTNDRIGLTVVILYAKASGGLPAALWGTNSDQCVDASCDGSYLCVAPHEVFWMMRSVNRYFVNRPQATPSRDQQIPKVNPDQTCRAPKMFRALLLWREMLDYRQQPGDMAHALGCAWGATETLSGDEAFRPQRPVRNDSYAASGKWVLARFVHAHEMFFKVSPLDPEYRAHWVRGNASSCFRRNQRTG